MLTAKLKTDKTKLWTCPTCKRKFERRGQSHSCQPFRLEQHFENKAEAKTLYQRLKQQIKNELGPFKVESLKCCIHLVSTFTFAAVKIFKSKIRVDFSLSRKIENKRFTHVIPMSAHRFLYCVDVMEDRDINTELMNWIKEAHEKKAIRV